MENEISDISNEPNIKKEVMDSPTNNIAPTNGENTSILQDEANTSTSHRPEISNFNQEIVEEENNETEQSPQEEIQNEESAQSPQEEIQNEESVQSPQEEIQNEEPLQSPQEEKNEDSVQSPQENKNEESVQSPQEEIQNEESVQSPQEEKNEDSVQSPQEEIQNEEPVQSPQEEKDEDSVQSPQEQIQNEEPVQSPQEEIQNEEPVQSPQEEIQNEESVQSPQEEIQNEQSVQSPQEEIQNEESVQSPQEEIQNEESVQSPQEEIQNEESVQSPQEEIQNEESIQSPQEKIQNEESIQSPQKEIQNEEPILSPQEQIQNKEPILSPQEQIQNEEPILSPQEQIQNEKLMQSQQQQQQQQQQQPQIEINDVPINQQQSQPQTEINDQPDVKILPINTEIPQDQSLNGSLNSAASNASEVLTNTWNSISNYLWSWFEPQEGVEGSQVPPPNNSNINTTKNLPMSTTTTTTTTTTTNNNNNNNNNNTLKSNETNTEETAASPLAASASYYANLIGSFFARPAVPTEPTNNASSTLTVEKKTSTGSLSASRLNFLSQQARMPSIQFIDREEQEENGVKPIIDHELTDYIRPHLPLMQRESTKWKLRYSTAQHGISLNTLYQQVKNAGPLLLAIRDTDNNIFGAYVSEAFHVSKGFYGTRECFLWKYIKGGLKMYPTSGQNEYFILSESNYIAIGGGNGCYGLYIDEDIQNGQSSECSAFFNEQLSSSVHFQILSLEVWSFEI